MALDRPRCKSCDHIFRHSDPQNLGEASWRCGLNPPTVSLLPVPGKLPGTVDIKVMANYPPVQLNMYGCSHHPTIKAAIAESAAEKARQIASLSGSTQAEPDEDVQLVVGE